MSPVQPSWDHGYPTASAYTCGFFRELTPLWLDFALLANGLGSPRRTPTASFRYLDLGCGMGYGLALLAALYPEGEFVGVDFQPDHLAHAHDLQHRLALPNLRFVEGDFLALSQQPAPLGSFHYVVSHGIATWVVPEVQNALFSLAGSSLTADGVFYCSYNCLPGWLAGSVMQTLVSLELARSDPGTPLAPVARATDTLKALLGTSEQPSPLAAAQPSLRGHLDRLPSLAPAYLAQEYACAGWQPLYAHQLHQRCLQHKLHYVSTATLPELSDDILPKALLEPIRQEANPMVRESLLDIVSNKAFRRDLFMKGRNPLPSHEREAAIGRLRLTIQEAPPQDSYQFPTTYGGITGNTSQYQALEDQLRSGSRTLAQLTAALDRPQPEVLGMALLLIHANRLALHRGDAAAKKATATCRTITPLLQELAAGGRPYEQLPVPQIGTAIPFSVVDALIAKTLAEGLDPALAAPCVQVGLHELGRRLKDPSGNPYSDDEQEYNAVQRLIEQFQARRQPALEALGLQLS